MTVNDLRHAGIGTCDRTHAWSERNGIQMADLRAGRITTADLRALKKATLRLDAAYLDRLIDAAETRAARDAS